MNAWRLIASTCPGQHHHHMDKHIHELRDMDAEAMISYDVGRRQGRNVAGTARNRFHRWEWFGPCVRVACERGTKLRCLWAGSLLLTWIQCTAGVSLRSNCGCPEKSIRTAAFCGFFVCERQEGSSSNFQDLSDLPVRSSPKRSGTVSNRRNCFQVPSKFMFISHSSRSDGLSSWNFFPTKWGPKA